MSLAERYPSAARSDLRGLLAWPMLGCGGAALVLALAGVRRIDEPLGWLAIGGALACGAFLVGLYRLREWARWGTFVLALVVVSLGVANIVREDLPLPWTQLVWRLLGALYYLALILYLPSAAATRAFQLARSRWVPRSRRADGDERGSDI